MMNTIAKAPCVSCPYRKDVPSGVWSAHEYQKLPTYDGDIGDQLMNGGVRQFGCHQQDGNLCAGWIGCHGAENLLAMRLAHDVAPEVWEFESPVPLFASGREACDHGMKDIDEPGSEAHKVMEQLLRKREKQNDR